MAKTSLLAGLAALLVSAGCHAGRPLTPLISAARNGDAARIAALVRQGADPNQSGGVNGWTPLLHAIHKNQLASVRALLDAGADANARYGDGETALMMAAGYGRTAIVNELLAAGADPRAKNSHGGTALDMAVGGTTDIDDFTMGSCQGGTVQALLAKAPDLRLSSKLARMAARIGGCHEILRLVDQAGAARVAAR